MTDPVDSIKALLSPKQGTQSREQKLEAALQEIAACATQCVCCEMHRKIAIKALGYDVEIVTDLT